MITPLRDLVLVELRDAAPAPSGLVSVVRLERPVSTYARVLAIGEEVRDVALGASVVISRLQGIEIGSEQLLLPESAVLAQMPLAENGGAGEAGGLLNA